MPNSILSKRVYACSITSSFNTLPLGSNHAPCAGQLTRFPNKIFPWVSRTSKSIDTDGVDATIFLKVFSANIRIISFLSIDKMSNFFNINTQIFLSPEKNTVVFETTF
jgi:hypothetical protein